MNLENECILWGKFSVIWQSLLSRFQVSYLFPHCCLCECECESLLKPNRFQRMVNIQLYLNCFNNKTGTNIEENCNNIFRKMKPKNVRNFAFCCQWQISTYESTTKHSSVWQMDVKCWMFDVRCRAFQFGNRPFEQSDKITFKHIISETGWVSMKGNDLMLYAQI